MRPIIVGIALLGAVVSAETLYFEDGTSIEVPEGSNVYVSPGTLWEFTTFESDTFRLQAVEPAASVVEVCDDGLTFGGDSGQCEEEVEVVEDEPEQECDELTFGGSGC